MRLHARLHDNKHSRNLNHPPGLFRLSDSELTTIGLSAAKVRSLRSLTEAAYTGQLPSDDEIDQLSDDEVINALTGIWGIGRWTAQTMLILRLCLSAQDMSHDEVANRWRPYRSLACWNLWEFSHYSDT